MAKGKHSEAQIIGALKQMEAGRSAKDVGRELGVSKHTIFAGAQLLVEYFNGAAPKPYTIQAACFITATRTISGVFAWVPVRHALSFLTWPTRHLARPTQQPVLPIRPSRTNGRIQRLTFTIFPLASTTTLVAGPLPIPQDSQPCIPATRKR